MPTPVGVRLPALGGGSAEPRPCCKFADGATGSQPGDAQSSSFGGAGAWSPTGVAGDGGGGPEEAALSGLAAAVAEPSASDENVDMRLLRSLERREGSL